MLKRQVDSGCDERDGLFASVTTTLVVLERHPHPSYEVGSTPVGFPVREHRLSLLEIMMFESRITSFLIASSSSYSWSSSSTFISSLSTSSSSSR